MKSLTKLVLRKSVIVVLACVCGVTAVYFGGQKAEEAVQTLATRPPYEPPTIVLDAGHGGMDGGCTSVNGVSEKGINLEILLHLRAMLQMEGYTVVVTRDTDRSIHEEGIEGIANQKSSDMDHRLALFNEYDPVVCVSIHQNQFTDAAYSGAQMFYSSTNRDNSILAQALQDAFVAQLQPENRREIKQCGKELFLCYFSENPTVMAECGFLSNPEEAALLESTEYQQKVAFTLFDGLNQYLAEKQRKAG